jgi:hypothetical protein
MADIKALLDAAETLLSACEEDENFPPTQGKLKKWQISKDDDRAVLLIAHRLASVRWSALNRMTYFALQTAGKSTRVIEGLLASRYREAVKKERHTVVGKHFGHLLKAGAGEPD